MKCFKSHVDPEVEEQLKWIKIEMENNVRRCLKLIKSINSNKEGNLKKKAEATQIIQDIQKEYQSLYAFYDNLRDEVRKKINGTDEGSGSSSDSESYYTPEELNSRNSESGKEGSYYTPTELNSRNNEFGKEIETSNQEHDSSDSEISVLKDKLTSTSEVKKSLSLDSLGSTDEIPALSEIVKDLKHQVEQSERRAEHLVDECTHLKDRLVEKEGEILSINKKHEASREKKLDEVKNFESQIKGLKLELQTILMDKKAFEDQVECTSNEAKKVKDENSALQARISEIEATLGSKDMEISSLMRQCEHDNQQSETKLKGLMGEVHNLQLEVDALRSQKIKLEDQLAHETDEKSAIIRELTEQINSCKQEIELVDRKKTQLELDLEAKSKEVEQCNSEIEKLRGFLDTQALEEQKLKDKLDSQTLEDKAITEEKEDLLTKVKQLEMEIVALSSQKTELEEQVFKTKAEADLLRTQKEEVERKISEMERNLKEKENDLSTMKTKFRAKEEEMSSQSITLNAMIKNLQQELEDVQNEKKGLQLQLDTERQMSSDKLNQMTGKNTELTNKIADEQERLTEMDNVVKKLNQELKLVRTQLTESRSSYQLAERRIEEMAEEFFKTFEDNLRILSRRIKVSEQLHLENKEVCKRTKEKYEQQNRDLKERMLKNEIGLKNMKEMSLTAYEMLSSLDSDALKFEECTANVLNRMSKVSCELKFAKDWIMRKNKAMLHVKDDLDCLLAQLDDKEAEILVFRERVWKSENKIRELEKTIKHQEDAMLVLKEEKREAIRQLCVWIDYHRSRSDYYKKMLCDITARHRGAP